MHPTTVYTKTQKGLEEIITRANRLPHKIRQTLIMVDGARTTQTLLGVLSHVEDLTACLLYLEKEGFITRSRAGAASSAAADTPLETAKLYLCDFARNMLEHDADDLVTNIERCQDARELMEQAKVCAEIVRNVSGAGRVEEFLQPIRSLLGQKTG